MYCLDSVNRRLARKTSLLIEGDCNHRTNNQRAEAERFNPKRDSPVDDAFI